LPVGIEGLQMCAGFNSAYVTRQLQIFKETASWDQGLAGADMLQGWGPEDDGYVAQMRRGFEFLRTHANGRYSDRTLMSIMRAADRVQDDMAMAYEPVILTLSEPFSFDEETEVKRGGTAATAVVIPVGDEGTRTCIAVAQNVRRRRYGTLLAKAVVDLVDRHTSFWTGNRAREALLFGLNLGLVPESMNTSGSVELALDPSLGTVLVPPVAVEAPASPEPPF
jgi:hypothetical protein